MIKSFNFENIKNKFRKKEGKKEDKNNLTKKQGVIVAELILVLGVTLVIAISCFFPAFRNLIEQTVTTITNWYTSAVANLTA